MRPPSVYAQGFLPCRRPVRPARLAAWRAPGRLPPGHDLDPSRAGRPPTIAELLGCDLRTVRRWCTATTTTAPMGRRTGPDRPTPAGQPAAGRSHPPAAHPTGRGPSPGCGSGWVARRSANAPCAGGSARWRPGGDPSWSPRATRMPIRSWPGCARPSPPCPTGRWCWLKTRPTSTCCPGAGHLGDARHSPAGDDPGHQPAADDLRRGRPGQWPVLLPVCRKAVSPDEIAAACSVAIAEILTERLPGRRLRAFPRAVKRKMSNFAAKRSHHR